MTNYVTKTQLSEKLGGRSIRSIERDVKSGSLPAPVKVGGTPMWPEDQIDTFLKAGGKMTEEYSFLDYQDEQQFSAKDRYDAALNERREARENLDNIHKRLATARDDMNALNTKLNGAKEANEEEIEARADAAAGDGEFRPDGDIIDIVKLETDHAVAASLHKKLNARALEARQKVDACSDEVQFLRGKVARKLLVNAGMDGRNKIPAENLMNKTYADVMVLYSAAKIAVPNALRDDEEMEIHRNDVNGQEVVQEFNRADQSMKLENFFKNVVAPLRPETTAMLGATVNKVLGF